MNILDSITEANVRAQKASARSPFPHMSVADSKVWTAFLAAHAISFESVRYDVAVGGKGVEHVAAAEPGRAMWETLLKKRIDAVVSRADDILTIEVKPLANMAALGQALSYAFLFDEEHRPGVPVRPVVVCFRVDADIEPVFTFFGVVVLVVSGAQGEPPSLEKMIGSWASVPGSAAARLRGVAALRRRPRQ